MPKNMFKIRDKGTGTFWNGDYRWIKFNEDGRCWKTKESAERYITTLLRYGDRFKTSKLDDKLEIVEFKIIEDEVKTHEVDSLVSFTRLKDKVRSDHPWAATFLDTMRARGFHNEIEFIFKIPIPKGTYRVDREKMKEIRQALRQLGVKARTYREFRGALGMMNREQAMKARLTLDVEEVVDLAKYRDNIK